MIRNPGGARLVAPGRPGVTMTNPNRCVRGAPTGGLALVVAAEGRDAWPRSLDSW